MSNESSEENPYHTNQIGIQVLGEINKVESPSLNSRVSTERKYLFCFPEQTVLTLNNGKTLDISDIEIDLSRIFIGGIGYGGGSAKLMSRAMRTIGHGNGVYNLPFTIEGAIHVDFKTIQMISTEDKVILASHVRDVINKAVDEGFTHINLPLDLNGHASLVTVVISSDGATLRFYDSLSPSIISYSECYHENTTLIEFIKTLLPETLCLKKEETEVLHLLDQGGEESAGGGYYTLYTALLLKDNPDLKNLTSFNDSPLLDQTHDKNIRAELVIRTLLDYGMENVVDYKWFDISEGIFNKIGNIELQNLIAKVKPLFGEFHFRFPKDTILTLEKGNTVDISGIGIDLSRIFRGGIGYGGGSAKLMARAMRTIGHGNGVYNLSSTIEGTIREDFKKITMISTEDKVISASHVRDVISKAVEEGFTHINLPIDLNGHASLVTVVISSDGATLRFYDSLSPSIMSYSERYHENTTLIEFIKTLLPTTLNLKKEEAEIFHLLDQGGKESAGCGYYTLYTALLLKDNDDLKNLTSFNNSPLLDQTHDKSIRAELVIRTLLDYGLENVVYDIFDINEGIFNKIGNTELNILIAKLKGIKDLTS